MEEEQIQKLKEEEIYPSDVVLNAVLGTTYSVFQGFIKKIESAEFELEKQWQYYHDAKAWFCKVQCKKKTIFGLTVWSGYFKLSFYFAEKYDTAITNLGISEKLKQQYVEIKRIGKIKPLIINVKEEKDLINAYVLIKYKNGILRQ